jgi:hypothetical protein
VVTGFGYLDYHGRIHSHSSGHRGRGDPASLHSPLSGCACFSSAVGQADEVAPSREKWLTSTATLFINLEVNMLTIRNIILVLGVLMSPMAASAAQVSIGIGFPHVSLGINFPVYPRLVRVSDYPVYYAPELEANFFFYDGMYWVFHNDNWYASSWYNGPWSFVRPDDIPVFILRVPVRYYRHPPTYFRGWRPDAPPRWENNWGYDWQQRNRDWNQWDRRAAPRPAPQPTYQRQYSRDQYPRQVERQHELQQQKYRYQPREPAVRQYYQELGKGQGQGHGKGQDRGRNK